MSGRDLPQFLLSGGLLKQASLIRTERYTCEAELLFSLSVFSYAAPLRFATQLASRPSAKLLVQQLVGLQHWKPIALLSYWPFGNRKPKSCLARGSFLARLFASSESRCGTRKLRFASKAPQNNNRCVVESGRWPSLDDRSLRSLRW